MKYDSLGAELDSIIRDYDYGIVPGSATIFVKDEINGVGRLDLTLLENVMVIVEVTEIDYKVMSCTSICQTPISLSVEKNIQLLYLNQPFDTMENLLMTVSPLFREKYQETLYNKLQTLQNVEQQLQLNIPTSTTTHTSPTLKGLNDWIN